MDYVWLIIATSKATGSEFPLVGYELEEEANDDLMNRADDKHFKYSIKSVPYYKK